jgi:hypothetical protein
MLCVGRNKQVCSDVHAGAGALFERDDGQAIQKMIENLFTLLGGLLGDAVAYLGRWRKDAAVVADLGEAAQSANRCSGCEGFEVTVVDFGSEAGCADLVKADELRKLQREPVRADCAMEGDEHLALLFAADALHSSKQPRSLGQKKLLVIVGVEVRGQVQHDRASESAIDVVGDDRLQHRALEDPIQAPIVGVEVIRPHRIGLRARFRLLLWAGLGNGGLLGRGIKSGSDGFAGYFGRRLLTLAEYSSCRRRGHSGAAGVLEVDGDGIAIDGVVLLFFPRKLLLLGFRLRFRDVGSVGWCIRAVAVDRVALRGGHRRRASGLGAGRLLRRL